MNVQLIGFGIINNALRSFCSEHPETFIDFFFFFFLSVNWLIASGMTLEIGFPQNYLSTLSYLRFINYLVFKKTVLIENFKVI